MLEFDASTRTAADAAAAIGCTVAQIAKSLVFRAEDSSRAVLVVASGVNRVDESEGRRDPRRKNRPRRRRFRPPKTGFAIGGVPPVGHAKPSPTLIDDALFAFAEIWAAAGTPNAVFRLTPDDLLRLTGGIRASIAR